MGVGMREGVTAGDAVHCLSRLLGEVVPDRLSASIDISRSADLETPCKTSHCMMAAVKTVKHTSSHNAPEG
jgi:hypothetical protein